MSSWFPVRWCGMSTQTNCMRTGGVSPGYITLCHPEADQGKELTFRGPSLAWGTVNIWERNHTVTNGKPGACSSLHILPSTAQWGMAPAQLGPVIRHSKELQHVSLNLLKMNLCVKQNNTAPVMASTEEPWLEFHEYSGLDIRNTKLPTTPPRRKDHFFLCLTLELGHLSSSSLAPALGFVPSAPVALRPSDSDQITPLV